jgi:predicted nuclease with RNAse H fold
MFVGIDVGARCLHCVALDDTGRIADVWLIDSSETSSLISAVGSAVAIAVDAPAQLSTAPHLSDPDLNRKFLPARCAEVALGRDYKTWVPWVTPRDRPASGWIETGLRVFEVLSASNVPAIEVYPTPVIGRSLSSNSFRRRPRRLVCAHALISSDPPGSWRLRCLCGPTTGSTLCWAR